MRCFILNRVSTEKQRENQSIQIQRSLHPRIADQLGCEYTAADVYDLDVSSTTYDHEKWNEVKKAVASGRYAGGVGIFGAIDRYHRDKVEWFELMVYLLRFNIRIVIPDTERSDFHPGEKIPLKIYDADQFKDLIQLVFEIEEAENFKRKLRKKVKLAFAHAREIGIDIVGTSVPSYGHTWKSERTAVLDGRAYGSWIAHPEEAKVVRKIIASELGSVKLAQWLNQHGYKTKRGTHWDSTAVTRVRRQLRVCARLRNGAGDIIEARNVEPLVTWEEYQLCQGRLGRLVRSYHHTTRKFPLIGVIRCGFCHDAGDEINLTRSQWVGSTIAQGRLYCQRKKFKAGPLRCRASGRGVNHFMVADLIIDDLLERIGNKKTLERAHRDYLRSIDTADQRDAVENMKRELESIDRKLRNLTEAVAEGFDRSLAVVELTRLKAQREEYTARLAALQSTGPREIPSVREIREIYRTFLRERKNYVDNALLNDILEAFIEVVYYYVGYVVIEYRLFGRVRLAIPIDAMLHRKIDMEDLKRSLDKKPPELARRYGVTREAIYYHLRRLK